MQLFLFTNQSGIGRGYYTHAEAEACNRRLIEMLKLPPPGFSGIMIAPEAPDQPTVYRKPSPRYISEMIQCHNLIPEKCWMAGDKLSDVEAGLSAGINSALIANSSPADLPQSASVFRDLPALITHLLHAEK